LAAAAAGLGDLPRAALSRAALEALRSSLDVAWEPERQRSYDEVVAAARAGLSQAEFGAAWAEGRAMSM